MRTTHRSVVIVTLLLLLNAGLAGAGAWPHVVQGITGLGFVLVPWMVIDVLRDARVTSRDLGDDEWGYRDRPDLRPRQLSPSTTPDRRPSISE